MTTTESRGEGSTRRGARGGAATTSENPSPPPKAAPGIEQVEERTYFSVAKLISRRFGGVGRASGPALFASSSQSDALVPRGRVGNVRRGSSFVTNLESLWRPAGGAGSSPEGVATLGWSEGWGWDEVKGNWKTFSSRQRRKLEKAMSKTNEEFALRDLLNRSNVVPIRKSRRSMSETELHLRDQRDQLTTEAAALKIQKYVNYRMGKNLNLYQQGRESGGKLASSQGGDRGGPKGRSQSYFGAEDFEPLAKASATLRASLADFGSSFQEIASKGLDGYPRLLRTPSSTSSTSSSNGSASSSTGKSDTVVPWSILPGVLRAWEKSVDEIALQVSQKQLEASEKKGKRKRGQVNVSLKDNGNFVNIFTTASLPWMTGTAVNPLLRAAYLSRLNKKVTLVVPWLSPSDQSDVYPHNIVFENPEQQEAYVMDWIKKRVPFEPNFKIKFYPAMYAKEKGSLLPIGDITKCVPDREADIAILEEPEHLNWYHPGRRWNKKFQYVVGIVHTNYLDYVSREEGGHIKKNIVKSINSLVCRAYCDKVIKLSGAVQHLPKSEICNVHGVSPKFLESSEASPKDAAGSNERKRFSKGVYFMGKALWAKGYSELLDLLSRHKKNFGSNIPLDVYGSGPDFDDIVSRARNDGLSLNFLGAKDHQDRSFRDYKVFINPSLSDVVATTTAEALAMGKFVIVAEHPSNHFFSQFPNCLVYKSEQEFSQCLNKAMNEDPHPLSKEDRYRLTWEAATERLINVAEPGGRRNITSQALDQLSWTTHHLLANIEQFRKFAGAGHGTKHAPDDIKELDAERYCGAGFFDRTRTKT
ncbi:glycosyltransferase [Chloropicon primus]|uniref:digalactosyldiacylglycerol synthase n=1 Tax=Chloropicon primus TaxID=1764295 RepID=A0A5B8MF18_9CHLO|nr:glycosyltransferase [Chloropicon primus]UPQ98447.1 glycosyltransferase [Chloropicon primus]|mmetsp:Transcript_4064/g.11814  ORF Transcript_4064/g.11814 Transcript_4064/m.11814 type:complete len:815 (-) Transcript_4064:1465-3909(-)|eukprot:QDZ19238.1 glycosyltransferase [Chloropicon primus]